MYNYEKRLQYPVNIKIKSPKIAQIVLSQYGGPDGESAAAMRYMSQKFAMKNPKVAGVRYCGGRTWASRNGRLHCFPACKRPSL